MVHWRFDIFVYLHCLNAQVFVGDAESLGLVEDLAWAVELHSGHRPGRLGYTDTAEGVADAARTAVPTGPAQCALWPHVGFSLCAVRAAAAGGLLRLGREAGVGQGARTNTPAGGGATTDAECTAFRGMKASRVAAHSLRDVVRPLAIFGARVGSWNHSTSAMPRCSLSLGAYGDRWNASATCFPAVCRFPRIDELWCSAAAG